MTVYGVVRTDRLSATKDGNIRSAKYYGGATYDAIENGMLVEVSELVDPSANREIFKAVKAQTTSLNVGVVATPEIIYDEQLKSTGALENFINPANQAITVLMLAPGDLLSVSDECINLNSQTLEKGRLLIADVSTPKWKAVASVSTETLVGEIIARELYRKNKYLNVIQIRAAN